LARHISRMNLRANSSADAEDVRSRQRSLQQAAADLLNQADMQVKLQESQMRLVRTQLLALERAESDLSTRAAALRAEEERPSFSGDGLLRLFRDRN